MLSDEGVTRMFNWAVETYVTPEVEARQADGRLPKPAYVYRAQVVFNIDKSPEVRLNREVRGQAIVQAARPMEAGEEISLGDIRRIRRYELSEDDPDAAHVTLLRGPDERWHLSFDWQHNTARVGRHLETAREFVAQAVDAVAAGRLRAFPEEAFAAAELLARAELLPLPDRVLRDAKSHRTVHSRYNHWARSGNTEQRFADLLNELGQMRASARYQRGDFELKRERAAEMLATLQDMLAHVESVSPDRDLSRRPRARTITAIAAEPIKAGMPVALAVSGLFGSGASR